ncbi:hypothetical protein KSP39_PZI014159 [Platanthera zijinensis]|uniref:Uncharacterized protein n=1 Tax=Platanthera zijinensis TaxID=2320716 RepID=A0AAP0BBJ3_9ASPA
MLKLSGGTNLGARMDDIPSSFPVCQRLGLVCPRRCLSVNSRPPTPPPGQPLRPPPSLRWWLAIRSGWPAEGEAAAPVLDWPTSMCIALR